MANLRKLKLLQYDVMNWCEVGAKVDELIEAHNQSVVVIEALASVVNRSVPYKASDPLFEQIKRQLALLERVPGPHSKLEWMQLDEDIRKELETNASDSPIAKPESTDEAPLTIAEAIDMVNKMTNTMARRRVLLERTLAWFECKNGLDKAGVITDDISKELGRRTT